MRRGARWVGWHRAMARAAPDGETRILLAIAAPLAVAQIGQMAMMLTASMVLGRLDSVALAGAWLLSLLVSLPLILLLTHITPLLRLFGVTADVAGYAGQFCRAYAWGVPAMLCSARGTRAGRASPAPAMRSVFAGG